MSLHAKLSPEAQARLEQQRRMSTVSSIVISLLFIVLVALILAFVFLPSYNKETPVIVTYTGNTDDDQQIEEKKLTNSVQRKPSAPASSRAKVIAANTTSPTAVPVPDVDVPQPTTDFGDGDDFGEGWGSGGDGGGGGGFGNVPATMRKRCSKEDRMERLLGNGGTERCEEVVEKGLEWLQATQADDGSWGGNNKNAMTGLALLAYLGRCETPLSPKYGDTVLKGIIYLVDQGMKQEGRLTTGAQPNPQPYEHAIATYALGEATTFAQQLNFTVPNLPEVTQMAGQYILDNQHEGGGWDYGYRTDGGRGGDLSVVAWQIQALKACDHTGLHFSDMKSAIRKALDYVERCQGSEGGFGYQPGRHGHAPNGYFTLTGAGMLSFQMWDKGSAAPVRKGARYINDRSQFEYNTANADLYGHYYEGQAMIARGGEQWEKYNAMFRDEVLDNQNPDGSWKKPGGGEKLNAVGARFEGDVHYRSCLAILMLEVYYRFLPGTASGI
jgi:hypothetical protein